MQRISELTAQYAAIDSRTLVRSSPRSSLGVGRWALNGFSVHSTIPRRHLPRLSSNDEFSRLKKLLRLFSKERPEASLVDRLHVGLQRADFSLLHRLQDRVVHELHALAFSRDEDVLELLRGAFANDGT